MMDEMTVIFNGKEYRVVRDGAASSDSQSSVLLRLDRIDGRLDGIETEQKAQRTELQSLREGQQEIRAQIVQLDKSQTVIVSRLDDLQTSVYWSFAGIGIFIGALAIPAFLLAVMSFFKDREPKPKTETVDIETVVRRVVRDMIPKVNS